VARTTKLITAATGTGVVGGTRPPSLFRTQKYRPDGNESKTTIVGKPTIPHFFEDYEAGNISRWTVVAGTPLVTSAAAYGGSGFGVRLSPGSGVGAGFGTSTNKWPQTHTWAIVRTRFRFNTLPSGTSGDIFTLQSITQTNNTDLFYDNVTGQLKADIAAADTLLIPGTVTTGTWYTAEARIFVGATTHTAEFRINGTTAGTISSAGNTSTFIRSLTLGATSTNKTFQIDYDDTYVYVASAQPDWIDDWTVAGNPAVDTLTDDFTTKDLTKWTWDAAASVSGGNAVIPCTGAYSTIYSNTNYSLTGSSIMLKWAGLPTKVGDGTQEALFIAYSGGVVQTSNYWSIFWTAGGAGTQAICLREMEAGSAASDVYVNWDATAMAYWRIRESGGIIYWETSPDATTWTIRRQKAPAAGMDATTVKIGLQTGYWGTGGASGNFLIDSINVAPIVPTGQVAFGSSSSAGDMVSGVTSRTVNVPTGAAIGDVMVAVLGRWGSGNPAVTAPAGWSQKVEYAQGGNFAGSTNKTMILWKRLTAADTGTYTFSWTGGLWAHLHVVRFTGVLASGDPIGTLHTSADTGSSGATTYPSTTLNPGFVGAGMLWHGYNDAGGTSTPPTGYTTTQGGGATSNAITAYRFPTGTGPHVASGGTAPNTILQSVLVALQPAPPGGGTTTNRFIGWGWGVAV